MSAGGIGYNYQFTPAPAFVVGLQADWPGPTSPRRSPISARFKANGLQDPSGYRQSLDWLGTVRRPAPATPFDRLFVYGMGGFAYGSVDYRANFYNQANVLAYTGRYSDIETATPMAAASSTRCRPTASSTRFNVLSLVGIQTAAVDDQGRVLHYDLGRRNVLVNNTGLVAAAGPSPRGSYTSRFETEGNLVRAGLSYKFNGL